MCSAKSPGSRSKVRDWLIMIILFLMENENLTEFNHSQVTILLPQYAVVEMRVVVLHSCTQEIW